MTAASGAGQPDGAGALLPAGVFVDDALRSIKSRAVAYLNAGLAVCHGMESKLSKGARDSRAAFRETGVALIRKQRPGASAGRSAA